MHRVIKRLPGAGWTEFLRPQSFAFRIVLLCVVVTTAALVLAFVAFEWEDWAGDRADIAADERRLMRMIAPQAALAASSHDARALAMASGMAQGDEHVLAAVWIPVSGDRLELMAPTDGRDAPQPTGVADTTVRTTLTGFLVNAPYIVNGKKLGELAVRTDDGDVRYNEIRNSLAAVVIGLAASLFAAAIACRLTRRALKPLFALDSGIESVRLTRDLGARADVISNDEFGHLAMNFNALLDDLQSYDRRLRESLDELTAAKHAAEDANALKSHFLANMSHEIRTPLNGVLTMARVMAMEPLPPSQRERLEVIEESGRSLLAVLNDVLDLSKIEAGKLEFEDTIFDAEAVVLAACAGFKQAAQAKGVAFTLDVADAAKGGWRGDPMRLRQVIGNLMSNAVKFTSIGEVRVSLDAEHGPAGHILVLRVADTGIGIPADVLPTLFEKFVQADNSMTRRFGGAGLGLAICRNIVELIGGVIEVKSDFGQGTAFEVRLPLEYFAEKAGKSAAGEQDAGVTPALAALRILAAEDNATNRQVLSAVLAALGVTATFVENGRQAVDEWGTRTYDLVLMDIQMPVLNGLAATQEIRAQERQTGRAHTPIIALSANAMDHQVAEYMENGFDACLAKPLVVDQLCQALAQVAGAYAADRGGHVSPRAAVA